SGSEGRGGGRPPISVRRGGLPIGLVALPCSRRAMMQSETGWFPDRWELWGGIAGSRLDRMRRGLAPPPNSGLVAPHRPKLVLAQILLFSPPAVSGPEFPKHP